MRGLIFLSLLVSLCAADPLRLYLQGFSASFSFAPSTGISAESLDYDGRNGGGIGTFAGDYAEGGSLSFPAEGFTFQELPFNQPNVRRMMAIRPISEVVGSIDFVSGQVKLTLDLSFEYRLDIGLEKKIARNVLFTTVGCATDSQGIERCGEGYGSSGRVVLVASFRFEDQQGDEVNVWTQDAFLEFPEFILPGEDCPSTPTPFSDFFDGRISMKLLDTITYWYLLNPGSKTDGILHFDQIRGGRVPLTIPKDGIFFAPIHVMAGVANISQVYLPDIQIVKIQIEALKPIEGFINICTGEVSYLFDTYFNIYIGPVLPYPPLSVICDLTTEGGVWHNETFLGERQDSFGRSRMIATAIVPATGSPIMDGLLRLPNQAIADLYFQPHLQNFGAAQLKRCFCHGK